jgi:5-methyltetrahydrofolate--homocysteine methyltransferase
MWNHEWMHRFDGDEVGCGELLSITHADLITAAHRALMAAGADALVTNTFGATSLVMENYGAAGRVSEANRESARLAMEVSKEASATRQPMVVASIGPTYELLSLDPKNYKARAEAVTSAYLAQIEALWEGGVRIFHMERFQDPLNAKAALAALARLEKRAGYTVTKLVTAEIEATGEILLGTSPLEFWIQIQPYGVSAFGIVGRLESLEASLASLARVVDVPLIAMVDAAARLSGGGWLQSPRSLSDGLAELAGRYKVRIAGVGVVAAPEFILALAEKLKPASRASG